jgi:hypothetical protein
MSDPIQQWMTKRLRDRERLTEWATGHTGRWQYRQIVGTGLMFYVAKILQALGLADVGYALFVGITKNFSMAEEIVLALIGLGVFSLGRMIERKVA